MLVDMTVASTGGRRGRRVQPARFSFWVDRTGTLGPVLLRYDLRGRGGRRGGRLGGGRASRARRGGPPPPPPRRVGGGGPRRGPPDRPGGAPGGPPPARLPRP